MESKFLTKCVNGHQIYKMCINKSCTAPAGICRVEECKYSEVHRKCIASCEVNDIVQHLMDFAKERSQETDELAIGTINRMMKAREILKNEYLSKSGSLEDQLRGNRKKLYELMKNGPANKITSQLLNDVLDTKEQAEKQRESILKLREIAERMEKMQKEGLYEMRKWIKSGEKINFVFNEDLTSENRMEVTNEGRNLKCISSQSNRVSLITPSLFDSQNKKITLRLTNAQINCSCLGLRRKDALSEFGFNFPLHYEEVYVVWSEGQMYNYPNLKQHEQSSDFRFSVGDTIQMEYQQSLQSLLITNLTNEHSVTLENISNENRDLHYCVQTVFQDDEWSIIEQI